MTRQLESLSQRMDQMQELMVKSFDALHQRAEGIKEELHQDIDILATRVGVVEARMSGFEQRLEAMEQRMAERQGGLERNMLDEFQKQTEALDAKITEAEHRFDEAVLNGKMYLELTMGKRISTLFEGCEMGRSHQAELERGIDRMYRLVEDLQARLAALENSETT